MSTVRRLRRLAWTACLALCVTACSDPVQQPSELSDQSSSTSSSASATASEEAQRQAIIAAYKGFFGTLPQLGSADEMQTRALLAPYGAGPAVDRLAQLAAKLRENHWQSSGSVQFAPVNVTVQSPTTAQTVECRDTTTETIVDTTTGAVVSQGVPGTEITATLKLESFTWLVHDYDAKEGAC